MSPVIQQIPGDLVRPIKDLKLGNTELLKTSKEILAADQELIAKSNKQIEELQKLNTEVAKLDPVAPVLVFYRQQFFNYGSTVEGAVLGPYNLEKYSTLSGYLQLPSTNLMVRVEYRDAEYPAGGFISQDEWGMAPGSLGATCSFNLPIRGPFVRLKFQGSGASGNATISLQANQIKGLPKFLASMTPLVQAEETIPSLAQHEYYILDIIEGPVKYILSSAAKCALVIYTYPIPALAARWGGAQINLNPATAETNQTSGILNLPPLPCIMSLFNLGASATQVQGLLWQ